jgi:hypothetical protein
MLIHIRHLYVNFTMEKNNVSLCRKVSFFTNPCCQFRDVDQVMKQT